MINKLSHSNQIISLQQNTFLLVLTKNKNYVESTKKHNFAIWNEIFISDSHFFYYVCEY